MALLTDDESDCLDGLLVLDLSQGIAGPNCGMVLRQQGARVIKVEPPGGDWARQMGRSRFGHTAISIAFNAGKESIVIDARTDAGQRALLSLAQKADVIIQNYRPGVVERMGLGYGDVVKINPRVIYVSISGWGADGPDAMLPALDTTMQALTGIMHVNQTADGKPQRVGFFLIDIATGLYAAQNVGMALYRAQKSGRGRHIQVSMLQVCASLQSYVLADDALFEGKESTRFNAPTGLFMASDGHIYISMLNDAMFLRLCDAFNFDDWRQDPSLFSSAGRMLRAAELNSRLGTTIKENTIDHWEQLLREHDILHGRVRHPRELLYDPQALHAQLFSELPIADMFSVPWAGLPGCGPGQPPPGDPPLLGQHTQALLAEFCAP